VEVTLLLLLPVVTALIGSLLGRRLAAPVSLIGALGTLGLAIGIALNWDSALGGNQFKVDDMWISQLGIHWALTIDGLNLALAVLAAFVYASVVLALTLRQPENPRLFFFHLGLGATSVIGALLAQDLLLFVLFFDLMLVPFYFLVGQWGTGDRAKATLKMVIYTLAGSLLMLAAAVATGVYAADVSGNHIDFLFSNLGHVRLAKGTQDWLFLCFAAAFLVKMPAVPLHGWLKDAYKSMPLPVLALFSGVLSKVAAYGFLKAALPLFPDAAASFQTLLLVLGLVSIIYGSALAFTTTDARLVVGYSSIAQLGFIVIGIFSLTTAGAQGALLQMVNHGIVTVLLVFIVGLLASRAKGSEDLGSMGGMAMGAPVLAVIFLIAALANLAMPASANFIGEFLILKGVFDSAAVIAVLACLGVAMAAVYMLRMYIRAMHGPDVNGVEQREISFREALPLIPATLLVLALALSPQPLLKQTEGPATAAVAQAALAKGQSANGKTPTTPVKP
jgi:NADH-quinone oxidoreductase subunit M